MTIEEARRQFPVLRALRVPERGHERAARARDRRGDGRAGAQADLERGRGGADVLRRARSSCATGCGRSWPRPSACRTENLSLATSTTNGCNIVLAGLGLGPEDEVITTDGEHFGLLGALAASPAQVRVAAVRELPPEQALEVLLAEVTPKTRLFALSHVCWMSGNRFPVERAEGGDGPAGARRRRSVGRRDRRRGRRGGLLRVLVPEVALRAGRHRRSRRCVSRRRCAVTAPSYLSQDGYEPTGAFTPRDGRRALRLGLDAAALAGRARRGARRRARGPLRARRGDGRPLPRARSPSAPRS